MIVLGIETATIEVGAGLCRDGEPLGAFVARPGLRHVETLHPAIEALVGAAGITLADVDAVAVDIGPGLFTGLRVGIAAAKTLAYGLKVPTIGVESTKVLLRQTELSSFIVVPVIDMRRSEIAWEIPGHDRITLGTPEELVARLEQLDDHVLLVGDGARRYADRLVIRAGKTQLHFCEAINDAPSVATLAALGCAALAVGKTTDPFELAPLYLRDADAKVNFAVREEMKAN